MSLNEHNSLAENRMVFAELYGGPLDGTYVTAPESQAEIAFEGVGWMETQDKTDDETHGCPPLVGPDHPTPNGAGVVDVARYVWRGLVREIWRDEAELLRDLGHRLPAQTDLRMVRVYKCVPPAITISRTADLCPACGLIVADRIEKAFACPFLEPILIICPRCNTRLRFKREG